MDDEKPRVVSHVEDAHYVDGKIIKDIRVTFYVGTDGPFSERFLKEGFTAELRDERLRAFAYSIRRT